MAQRLEIGWLNVARVRALCLAVRGYDPEIETWDQSPFHHNESGSQNMTTLAVGGCPGKRAPRRVPYNDEGEVGNQHDNILERRTP